MTTSQKRDRRLAQGSAVMALAALGGSFVLPVILSLAARRAGAFAGRAASPCLSRLSHRRRGRDSKHLQLGFF